jgi:LemA protein
MTDIVILFLALGLVAWVALAFNRLVRDRNRTRAGWSDIDVQLQRRHDLIPRLVEAVRGYAGHERATLEAITELRTLSQRTERLAEKAALEDRIESATHRLLALAESYPDLKANNNFLGLQKELVATEDHLQYARRFYNGAVRAFNTRLESFPDLVIARAFGFTEREFFRAEEGAAAPVRVELGG